MKFKYKKFCKITNENSTGCQKMDSNSESETRGPFGVANQGYSAGLSCYVGSQTVKWLGTPRSFCCIDFTPKLGGLYDRVAIFGCYEIKQRYL